MTTSYKRKIKVRLPQSVEDKIVTDIKNQKGYVDTGDINKFIVNKLFNVLVAEPARTPLTILKTTLSPHDDYKDRQVHITHDIYKGLKNASYENQLPDIQITLSVLCNNYLPTEKHNQLN